MGVLYSQASFKNSRVSTRKATTQSITGEINILTSSPNTLISAANLNRTYLTLRNENATAGNDIRYAYSDSPTILTTGFLLKAGEAVDLESPQDVYARAVVANVLVSTDEGTG